MKLSLTPQVLEGFVRTFLLERFDNAAEIPEFHKELWGYCCSKEKQVAIAAPRGHAKSTAVTLSFSLASVLFRTASYVIIVSDSATQSEQFLGDIAKELFDNDKIQDTFGAIEIIKRNESDIIGRFMDGKMFRIQAKGAGQSLRGLKWDNKRPDLVVVDDLEDDEAVMNRDRRDKLRKWFYNALLPMMSVSGRVRMVGTILHMDSLLERLMPERQLALGGGKNLQYLVTEGLRQYASKRVPATWYSVKYRAHSDDFTEILWASKYEVDGGNAKQALQAIRASYVNQGLGDSYSQEFLNIPLDSANAIFRQEDFVPFTEAERKKNRSYYVTCDLAVSKKDTADYSVFLVAAMDDSRNLYVEKVIRERLDTYEIVETLFALQNLYQPLAFGIETGILTKTLLPVVEERMLQDGVYPNLVQMPPVTDKIMRTRPIQARIRAGTVKFDVNAPWFFDFQEELCQFPRSKHDDQVDAFSWLGQLLNRMMAANTPAEDEEEEENERKQSFSQYGRNKVTGY